jgi:hypothetical protein
LNFFENKKDLTMMDDGQFNDFELGEEEEEQDLQVPVSHHIHRLLLLLFNIH